MTGPAAAMGLRGLVAGRGRTLVVLTVWSLVAAVPVLLSGLLVARAVDAFVAGRTRSGLEWLALYAVATIIGAWGTRRAFQRLADIVEPVRDRLVTGVVFGAIRRSAEHDRPGHTADTARITGQVEIVREALAGVLLAGLEFTLVAAAALVGLVLLQPVLLVLVLPPVLLALGALVLVLRRMAARQLESIVADESLAVAASRVASTLRDVRADGAEHLVRADVGRTIEAQASATRALGGLTATGVLVIALGSWVPLLLVLGAGPHLVSGGITAGAVLGAATYVMQGLQPALDSLVRMLSGAGLWLTVTWRRLQDAMAESPVPERISTAVPEESAPLAQLQSVSFTYGAAAGAVVSRLDLRLDRGDHLVVVGPSGIGKSTLTALLSGLLDPAEGRALVAGADARQLSLLALAQCRTLVPQESFVFLGSVRENLAYLHTTVSDEALHDALRALDATTLVARLGGLDADLVPGELSAAERQLVCLVRAYVSSAPLVVLDEATCHLDPSAEALVEAAFAERSGALVVVAHRMTSALRAKQILVMDGREVVVGTHAELLGRSTLYADLVGAWGTGDAERRPGSTGRLALPHV